MVGKFPNGTRAMIKLLRAERPALDWVAYCAMPPVDQLVWEERGDDLTKSILFLMNLKNDNTKKDLCLAYSQGNKTVYPPTIKVMARYMSTQYPNKNSFHQHKDKEGIETERRNDPKSEDKDNNTTSTAGAHVGDTTTPEDSNASSGGTSIGAHVSEATE